MFKRVAIILMSSLLIVACAFVRVIAAPLPSSNSLVKPSSSSTQASSGINLELVGFRAVVAGAIVLLSQYHRKKSSSNLISNVYVAGSLNNHIQKFDVNGIFLIKWGSTGLGNGQFNGPCFVAVANN